MTRSNPPGCKSAEDWERELTSTHDDLLARGRELIVRNDRVWVASGKELILAGIRAARLAGELAHHRAEREALADALEQQKRLAGHGRDHTRPRLKLKATP